MLRQALYLREMGLSEMNTFATGVPNSPRISPGIETQSFRIYDPTFAHG